MHRRIATRYWRRQKRILLYFLVLQCVVSLILFCSGFYFCRSIIEAQVFPYVQVMEVTAYTAGPESTGKDVDHPDFGLTANTHRIAVGSGEKCLAAPPEYSFGTRIFVPGYGTGAVKDRGEDISGNRLDVYFDDVDTAHTWGRKRLRVVVFP